MLKTTRSIGSAVNHKKTKGKVNSISMIGNSMVSGVEVINPKNSTKRKNQAKTIMSITLIKFKNRDFPPNFRNIKAGLGFLTFKTRLTFIKLRQAFIEAPILHHFNLECHIQIKINISGYTIGRILSQLILNKLG